MDSLVLVGPTKKLDLGTRLPMDTILLVLGGMHSEHLNLNKDEQE